MEKVEKEELSEKIEVRLWSDQSEEAEELCDELRECGYEVDSRFNGSHIPQAWTKGMTSKGFAEIRLDFLSNPITS